MNRRAILKCPSGTNQRSDSAMNSLPQINHMPFAAKVAIRIALPALLEYSAGAMSRQYTIRTVPAPIDRALRQRARQEAKSLNTVALEALARGLELELDAQPAEHTDLDALVGSWQEDKAFDRAVADFERVDEDAWK
ncbi:MAG: hypothetical protein ACI9VS_002456 [Candidatus Binatia bacterium]|jgi:hypothetical protein